MDRAQRWQTIRAIVLGIAVVGGVVGLARFLDGGSDQPQPASSSTNDIATTVAPTAPLISTEDLTTNAASLSSTADAICAESEDVNTAQEDAAKNAIYDETGAHIISPAEVTINRKAADFRQKCASATRAKDFAAGAVKDRESDPLSFTIDMSVSVISGNPLTVSGTTNLPDGTPVDIDLRGNPATCAPRCFFEFNPTTVKDGAFSSEIQGPSSFSQSSYTIDVAAAASTDNSSKHFRGPYVATIGAHGYVPVEFPPNSALPSTDVHLGMMIHYTQRILILYGGEIHFIPCDGADQTDPGINCGDSQKELSASTDDRAINDNTDAGNYNNPNDPYSKQANDAIIDAYVAARKAYLSEVRGLIFAADCGVLFSADPAIGEQSAQLAMQPGGEALRALGDQNVVTAIDTHIGQMIRMAIGEGQAQAKQAGACDYWRQHPEAVAIVRQAAIDAAAVVSLP